MTSRTKTAWRWVCEAPAERVPLPAAGVSWGAAEAFHWAAADILHAASVSGIDISLAAGAAAGVTFGVTHWLAYRRRKGDDADADAAGRLADAGRKATLTLAAAGGWLALAARYGPLAGPYCGLSDVYAAAVLLGYRGLRNHDSVRAAREWRQAKADWHGLSASYGIAWSHLLGHEQTRVGERWEVDVRDTGSRASRHASGDLAERIAEVEQLPPSRVQVTRGRIAGRIEISVRHRDPWDEIVAHPVLDDDPDFDLPVPCTIRDPVIVGYEPETWQPITLDLWDPDIGGKNILLTGMKGAGKTTLLNCIRERVTAAEDAILIDINLSKALEDLEWSPACDMSAIGEGERQKAAEILALVYEVILWRPAQGRDTAKHQPTRKAPLIVVIIDEIDKAVGLSRAFASAIRQLLTDIASSGRSEGVSLVLAGQRGTAQWIGGPDVRANIDTFCVGKVNRRGEARNAAAELGDALPSMITYGEGKGGVWGFTGTDSDDVQLGRTFALFEPLDIREIAWDRRDWHDGLEPALAAHLGGPYERLRAPRGDSEPGPAPSPEDIPQPAPGYGGRAATAVLERTDVEGIEGYEAELDLPADLRARFAALDEKLAGTRQGLADLDKAELPSVDPGQAAAAAAERWAGLVSDTSLTKSDRERVLAAIAAAGPAGTSIRQLAGTLGMEKQRNLLGVWIRKLAADGAVRREGEKRGSRVMINDDGSS